MFGFSDTFYSSYTLLGPKEEGVLYHYTSHDTLYKIVESRTLRASHIYYMNDSNEVKYAIDRFIAVVKKRTKSITKPKEDLLLEQIPQWLKNNMRTNPHYIFSFSLSESGNSLSQWQAYTQYGTGVSIGFNHLDVENFAAKNGSLLDAI